MHDRFYVFDLDGTLANLSHRLHYIQSEPKRWDAFFAASVDDEPIQHVIDLLQALDRDALKRIEIWSGRSDAVRTETQDWLRRHGIHPGLLTHMRKAGDHRPDYVVKKGFLALSDRRPDVIFDDRQQVVDMWRAEGIPAFQVAPGDF